METKSTQLPQIKDSEPKGPNQEHLTETLKKILTSYGHIRRRKIEQKKSLQYFGLSSIMSEGIGWAKAEPENKSKFEDFNRILEDSDINDKEKKTLENALISADTLFEDLLELVDTNIEHDSLNNKEFVIKCARFNQRFAYALFSEITYSKPKTTNARLIVSMLEALSDREDLPRSEQFRIILHGVKAHAGLMNLLISEKFFIRALNWRDRKEIELFDLNGVDFIAVNPDGKIYLIDARGQKFYREEGISGFLDFYKPACSKNKLPREKFLPVTKRALELLSDFKDSRVKKALRNPRFTLCTVTVPVLGDYMDHFGKITDSRVKDSILTNLIVVGEPNTKY